MAEARQAGTDFVHAMKELGASWRQRDGAGDGQASSDRRERIDAHISQQMLFEKWLKLDQWRLRDEAIPLLLGIDPEDWDGSRGGADGRAAAAEPWSRLQDCVRQGGGPRLSNGDAPAEEWRVSPRDLHGWATSVRLPVPAAFDLLMSFIRKSVLADDAPPDTATPFDFGQAREPAEETASATAREQILGAALTMLANFPGDCRDENGFVEGHRIASLILRRRAVLFEHGMPEMPQAEIGGLLDRWIRALE